MSNFARAARRLSRSSASQWLLALAWVAMVCRAILPTGYMPSEQGGVQWLTLCSAAGHTRVVAVALFEGQGSRPDVPAPQAAHCVFAAQSAGSALPPPTAVLSLAFAQTSAIWLYPAHFVSPSYLERGAPLGARAPPLVLAA